MGCEMLPELFPARKHATETFTSIRCETKQRCAHRIHEEDAVAGNDNAIELRRIWETEVQRRELEAVARREADLRRRDRLEAEGDRLREELGSRLAKLMEDMEPYVDGTMGEPAASMVAAYTRVAQLLGGLYGLLRPPRVVTPLPVLPEPPPVPEEPGEEERRVALEEARAAGLEQLASVRRRMLEAGKG